MPPSATLIIEMQMVHWYNGTMIQFIYYDESLVNSPIGSNYSSLFLIFFVQKRITFKIFL